MRLTPIAIATALLAVGANAATFHVETDAELYSSAPGTIVTVTVTMTSAGVIGTLLLEVLVGALPGSDLGLSIGGYMNPTLTDPAGDPNITLTSNFTGAMLVNPEPATAALLAVGLVGLGLAGRRRARRP